MTLNPRLDILTLINGFQITQAIHVASTLRVADHLKDGPRSSDELASLTKSHAGSLYRLLRALAAVGIFREMKTGHLRSRRWAIACGLTRRRRSAHGRNTLEAHMYGELGDIFNTAFRRARTLFRA